MGNRTVALLAAGALMSLSLMLAIAPAHAVDVDPGPIIESVGAAPQPVEVGSIMTATARFTDLNTGPHTAQLGWGDGTTSVGTVTQSGADGTVTGQHTYQVSGWYHLSVYVANDQSESDQEVFNYSATAYQPSKKDKFVGGKSFITPAHTFVDDQYNNYPATFDFAYQYDGDQPVAKKTFTLVVR